MDAQDLLIVKNKYGIVGKNEALDRAIETALLVAPSDLSVLVVGESGVGKENIPKIIHQYSSRKTGKYFAVNCGAIPEGTIESELFGHVKGSFTGAVGERKGYFEEADGGTLFLDEIGELPLPYQAKLLRVLQSGEFTKVGSSKVSKTNVRVIAATNVDLVHAVAQGKFRRDLYYRLNAVQVRMPALREMPEDIERLFRYFASEYASKLGMRKVSLTPDAVQCLKSYRWPGNIRQLKNVAESVQVIESARSSGLDIVEVDRFKIKAHLPSEEGELIPVQGASSGISMETEALIQKLVYKISELESRLNEHIYYHRNYAQGQQASLPPSKDFEEQVSIPHMVEEQVDDQVDDQTIINQPVQVKDIETSSPATLEENEKQMIIRYLKLCKNNRKKAAEMLGFAERTLYRKLKKYDIRTEEDE